MSEDTDEKKRSPSLGSHGSVSGKDEPPTLSDDVHVQKDGDIVLRTATEQDLQDLPHVMMKIPPTVWLLAFTGSATAFARYGVSTPFQNYIQNPPNNPHLPGALNLGEEKATIITNVFMLFVFLTPLPMGLLSDTYLGRYRTMILSISVLLLGYTILVLTSLPISLAHNAGLAGLIASNILIGLGQGGLSAVMYAFIGDQIPTVDTPLVVQTRNRKLVIPDRNLTVQFIFNAYFWGINLGSLSLIGTTFLERVDFWVAYLMPLGVLALAIIPLFILRRNITRPPLRENIVPKAFAAILFACGNNFSLTAASSQHPERWSPAFTSSLRRGLRATQVMLPFPIFWLCFGQSYNNIISQAGQMQLSGLSNDTIGFLNVLAVVVLGPIIQSLLTLLRKHKIDFGPMRRITAGFVLAAMALGYTAGLQKLIYSKGPCYEYPLECPAARADAGGDPRPNEVNIWLQAPIYVLLAASEILGYVSMTEYAYAEAPVEMKAIAQAGSQFMVAVGFGLGIALGPVARNPWLEILFACLSGVAGATALLHWLVFRRRDRDYELGAERGAEGGEDEAAFEGERSKGVAEGRGEGV